MSYLRFRMDLAIKEPIPPSLEGQLNAIKHHMVVLKSFSEKINKGRPNEEDTTMLEEHLCNHDTGKRCGSVYTLEKGLEAEEENKNNDTMGELCSLVWVPFTKWGLARHK
jgi:hypothetical protein